LTARLPLLVGLGLLFIALIATGLSLNRRLPRLVPGEVEVTSPSRSLSARIPSGQVAASLRLGRVESIGGAIRAGDVIDVYAFFTERATGGVASTRVLMREKLVYAASANPDAVSITLALPPEEAALLQDALQIGTRPYAILRSSRGMAGREAPNGFQDDALAPWIARVSESR
jgi:hypothetical protein